MNVLLQAATPADLDRILPLVQAYHEFEHIDSSAAQREAAVGQLLGDADLGGIWLVLETGKLAGYVALCRGFSIEFNGFDAFVDEFYLAPEFRGRGIGKAVLAALGDEARRAGIKALHLEVARDNEAARRLYTAAGFEAREKYVLMSVTLDET